ncbi:alpha/beta fold hydrolase [Shewanella colwelliana]|uniref:alpha/beta fold hydrolase n=1 Tax=Shewanella colwelliana TaxID=23 RepID=UPI0012DEDF30
MGNLTVDKILFREPFETQQLLPSEILLEGDLTQDGALGSETLIVFAHGAGANMLHPFMTDMAQGLAHEGMAVARFNFPYMRANAFDGKRRPPDGAPKLVTDFNLHIAAIRERLKPKRLVLMGKSMGGRMAAIVADHSLVDGVICLGYPFVPPKGGEPRLEPIQACQAPLLVIQGERDKFGGKGEVESWLDQRLVKLAWLPDGDHSFVPRKSSGTTQAANLNQAISYSVKFIRGLDA